MICPVDLSRLAFPYEAIETLCRRYDVRRLAVFGSVLRDDFRDTSDVDFLVEFENNDAGPWLAKLQDLESALSSLLGRTVQLCDFPAVNASRNYIFRSSVLSSARTIYVA